MEGMSFPDCPEFDIWLVGEREFWRQRVIQSLQTLIDYHHRRGDDEEGVRLASRLLALAPWREEGHRQLMRFLARSGQRAAALAQYETCRRILQRELGVPPSAETRALYERIRDAPAPRHNLPLEPTPFVGRGAELTEIARALNDAACRLLTLVGPGGVGKTRLAVRAARDQVRAFLHGVFFVPLAGLEEPHLLATAIAEALGLRLTGHEPAADQLLAYLRDKELLLVLDNFEHLLTPSHTEQAVSLVLKILQQAPGVKVMVTSHQRLNLRWEWLIEVKGLPYPDRQAPAEATYSAVTLFVQSARRAMRRSLEGEMEEVARLCRLLEGLPLGIELAAAWTGEYSCAEIARQVERGLDALSASAHDYPPRHRSLRAVCDYSWSLLNSEEQQAPGGKESPARDSRRTLSLARRPATVRRGTPEPVATGDGGHAGTLLCLLRRFPASSGGGIAGAAPKERTASHRERDRAPAPRLGVGDRARGRRCAPEVGVQPVSLPRDAGAVSGRGRALWRGGEGLRGASRRRG